MLPPRLGLAVLVTSMLVGAGMVKSTQSGITPLIIAGDAQGYLSPCGCSDPMTGGIRRMATALGPLRGANGVFLVNGGLVSTTPLNGVVGRKQNEFKAETLAEAYSAMRADAVNIGPEELSGGSTMLAEIKLLAPSSLVSTSVASGPGGDVPRWRDAGPFLVGGATQGPELLAGALGGQPVDEVQAAHDLVAEAKSEGKTPIMLLRDDHAAARQLALAEPGLALIVFRSTGVATTEPELVGTTVLVSPGDRSQQLVRLNFDGKSFSDYEATTLTPDFKDDPAVDKLFHTYLKRIDAADLLRQLPRAKTKAFAGSMACQKCHTEAYNVWHASGHAHALADLERVGQARDPDCVSCHVTGLGSTVGFRTRTLSPSLANVTCESCHGPAADHAAHPKTVHLPRIGVAQCLTCHTTDNSHNFEYKLYWSRVSHH